MLLEIENKIDRAILDPEHFNEISSKKEIAFRNALYIKKIADKSLSIKMKYKLYNRANRINNCMSLWWWNLYKENKIMDFQKVWRCKDMYCPNCRAVDLDIQIRGYRKYFNDMIAFGYNPYFLTLTIPNINLDDIYYKIDMINKAFLQLWLWLNRDDKKGFKDRMFDVKAATKSIEMPINKENKLGHLHIHAILFIDNESESDFEKNIEAYYRKKSNEIVLLSNADIEMAKLWTMAVKKENVSQYKKLSDSWENNYKCDIRPIDLRKGLNEAFKYSFKDTDINDYDIFKSVFFGFRGHRIRQSYGKIKKFELKKSKEFDIERVPAEISDYLQFDEEPEILKTHNVKELNQEYKDFKKISRKKAYRDLVNIKD